MILGGTTGDLVVAAKPPNEYGAFSTLFTDTFAGVDVSPEGALALAAVYGAVSLIANTCGTLPCEVYDESKAYRELVKFAPVATMLRFAPNEDMAASTYWTLAFAHLLLRGNHYAAKLRLDRRDPENVTALYPIAPDKVTPFRAENGDKRFRVAMFTGSGYIDRVFDERAILHLMGPSFDDGLTGASPIAVVRNRIGVQLAQSEYQARFYEQGAALKGVLSTPHDLTPEAAARIKQQWRISQAGLRNAHDIAVLHGGASFQNVSITPEDAQFIETMKWGATEIATVFNIPASRLNADSGSNSIKYANAGQDDMHFFKSAILPRLRLVEDALNKDVDLFGATSRWVPRFNADAVLRVDMKTRYEAYTLGRQGGWLSPNDVRRAEDMAPAAGGDVYGVQSAPVAEPAQRSVEGGEVVAMRDGRLVRESTFPAPIIQVQVPEQPAPVVHVEQPVINVDAPVVQVQVPEQPAPVVHVPAPVVNVDVAAPEVKVDVAAPEVEVASPQVTVEMPADEPKRVTFERDQQGRIIGARTGG